MFLLFFVPSECYIKGRYFLSKYRISVIDYRWTQYISIIYILNLIKSCMNIFEKELFSITNLNKEEHQEEMHGHSANQHLRKIDNSFFLID